VGQYIPNHLDLNDYHCVVGPKGEIYEYPKMKHKPEDNVNCQDGNYAQHCYLGNTGCIGISFCGMLGYTDGHPEKTKFPLTEKQIEAGCKRIAKYCKDYGIEVSPDTVFTHYEHDKSLGDKRQGKIDITYMHPFPTVPRDKCGDFLRSKVSWYLTKI
jgi:hypothetical protein